jgi:hypothetical protein
VNMLLVVQAVLLRGVATSTGGAVVTAACTQFADCRPELQAALDSGAGTVLVPRLPSNRPWLLSCPPDPAPPPPSASAAIPLAPLRSRTAGFHGAALQLRSNQRIVLASGVVLLAVRESFHGLEDGFVMGTSVANVSIVGQGPLGATLQMWKADYANASRYTFGMRMGITLSNVSGVFLQGLTVRGSGGDGLYFSGVRNGVFSRLILDNNYRQGLSIISASNVLFEDCRFINTGMGAASSPACGVDLEPNGRAGQELVGIMFRRCIAANNTGCGFSISPHNLLSNSTPRVTIGVTFEDCHVDSRGQLTPAQCKEQGGCGWTERAGFSLAGFPPGITGVVSLRNCSSVGGAGPALRLDAKGAGTHLLVKDSYFTNTVDSSTVSPVSSVVLMAPLKSGKFEKGYGPYVCGNVTFDNVTVVLGPETLANRQHHRAWLTIASPHGLTALAMNASVIAEPNSGGCSMVKEERVGAKLPWIGAVEIGHSCVDVGVPTGSSVVLKSDDSATAPRMDLPRGNTVAGFVQRQGSHLVLDGKPFRFGAANLPKWLGMDERPIRQMDLFVGGPPDHNGTVAPWGTVYDCFRVPSAVHMALPIGLLVFAESRVAGSGCADQGPTDITMRQSTDSGLSFGKLNLVIGPRAHVQPPANASRSPPWWWGRLPDLTARNPYAVGLNGSVLLAWTNTTDKTACVNLQTQSTDGLTWSRSTSLPLPTTSAAPDVPPLSGGLLLGPGSGIVLGQHAPHSPYAGTIVICGATSYVSELRQFLRIFTSKDGGRSYQPADGAAPFAGIGECQLVELSNGTVMVSARNEVTPGKGCPNCSMGDPGHRVVAISNSGGESWEPFYFSTQLIDPSCMVIRLFV